MIGNVFTLKQLEALVWVADLGSFRKAAQRLNTTQPNISSRIAALESTLGVVLMQRDAGSVRMTARGTEILTAARAVLRASEALITTAERLDLVADRLRLGVTELVACTWLHAFLRRLKDAYPGIVVELTVDLSRNLDQQLSSAELDLTLQSAPFSHPVSGEIDLGNFPYVWVAAIEFQDTLAGRHTLADLVPHTVMTHARHTEAYAELAEYAGKAGLAPARFVASNSLASCVQMAADGLGVALLPAALARSGYAAKPLMIVDVDWTPTPLRFAARFQAERARQFIKDAADIAAEVSAAFQAALDKEK